MKTSLQFLVLFGAAAALAGCSSDDVAPGGTAGGAGTGEAGETGTAGSGATAGKATGGGSSTAGGAGVEETDGGEGGIPGSGAGAGPMVDGGAGGEGGAAPTETAWYQCQSTDQAFVRRAIQGILGRHANGQAEVNLYTDMITQIDALDNYDPEAKITAPITKLRHSRQVVVNALLASPDYQTNWAELYKDFVRIQRIDQLANPACTALRTRTDAKEVAKWIRDQDPLAGSDGKAPPTFADVVVGSLELDDMTPIYTENLFTLVNKTYDGANASAIANELSRRADYGAWFDGTYLNRDAVCLNCHNSEFSVTQSEDPALNRHYPVPGLFEKALFGSSVGPDVIGGFGATDRMHASLRRAQFLATDCTTASAAQVTAATTAGTLATCAVGDPVFFCSSDQKTMCSSKALRERNVRPWGMASACGTFIGPTATPIDMAFVEAKLGNITGYRSSMFDVVGSLRSGFNKLKVDGLAADSAGNIADPDKAFSYLVAMTIVEKVWREVVGTPLTIANYYPRNAAERDQLFTLTEAFIKSGYSNKALLSEIFASPYLNMAAPDSGCVSKPYSAPRIFDPWRTAEILPADQGNSITDGIQAMSPRTQARVTYNALGWPLAPYGSTIPGSGCSTAIANTTPSCGPNNQTYANGSGENAITANGVNSGNLEFNFQVETGFPLKNAGPGFRGLDFQGKLGFEDRFGQCKKIFTNTTPDVIELLVAKATPGAAKLGELLKVLKDRLMGETTFAADERTLLQGMMGASFDADASTVPDLEGSLRRACGVMTTTPQNLLLGLQPKDGSEVPALTPEKYSYQTLCAQVAAVPLSDVTVTCTSGAPLTVNVKAPAP